MKAPEAVKKASGPSGALVGGAFAALCLTWGLAFIVFHVGLTTAPPLTYATCRAFLAGLSIAGWLVLTGHALPRDRATHTTALVCGALNVAGFWGLQNMSLRFVPPAETAILVYIQPLLTAFGAWLWLGEGLSPVKLLGLLAGVGGVIAVVGAQLSLAPGAPILGLVCALGGGISWASGTVFFKSRPARQSLLWIVALQALYGSVPLAVSAILLERPTISFGFTFVWTIAYASVASSALAYVLWFWLLRQRAASEVAAFIFLVPLVATIGDSLLLGDHFGLGTLAGGLLIVLGIGLVNRPTRKKPLASS